MTAINDNFNRADSDSLGANWTEANGDCDIVGNEFHAITGSFTNNFAAYTGTSLGNDQYVKFQMGTADVQYPVVIFRYTNSSSPFYVLNIDGNAGTFDWYYFANATDSGTAIQTGVSCGGTLGTGSDGLGFTIEGSGASTVVRCWHNPTANAPDSVSSWDSGAADGSATTDPGTPVNSGAHVGLGAQQGSASLIQFNEFWAGDFGGGGAGGVNSTTKRALMGVG